MVLLIYLRHLIEYKKGFYEQLKTNKIFIASDGSEQGSNLLNLLKGNIQDEVLLLESTPYLFDEYTQQLICDSSAVIGIWASNESLHNDIITQVINYALKIQKPCLVFCEKNIYARVKNRYSSLIEFVRFDQDNSFEALRQLNKVILDNQVRIPAKMKNVSAENRREQNSADVAGWAALGIVGGVLLGELFRE